VKAKSPNRLFSEKERMLSEKLLRMKEVAQLLSVTPTDSPELEQVWLFTSD
jgi:hypothetical protein